MQPEEQASDGSLRKQDDQGPTRRDDGGLSADDRAARAIRQYLGLLRDALLDEHYLENELRIEHLLECIGAGRPLNVNKLSNPVRYMPQALRELKQQREAGETPSTQAGTRPGSGKLAYAAFGSVRLNHLEDCLEVIRSDEVSGDLVEVGTGRGGGAIFMRGFLKVHELTGPRVWVADQLDVRDSAGPNGSSEVWLPPDLNALREAFARFRLLDDRVVFLQGPPSRTLAEASIEAVALLRVSSSDPEEIRAVLEALYHRVTPGGFLVIDGYGGADCQAAVDGFRSERGVVDPVERVDWSEAAWRKTEESKGRNIEGGALSAGPKSSASLRTKDLGVVVVFHNMRREAARTLHSLTRSYQRDIDELDYEVVVVENGSSGEQRLGEEFVRSFGPEFRYLDLGDEATPSPAGAINRGVAVTAATTLALMIDGAHVLTPGVLHYGMKGLSTYAPAIASAKQWYVGPGQQPEAVAGGYDRAFEDQLFAEIDWPTDGYRLFEVGHFIGDRDWFDGDWESNCIFVRRALLEQVGGMDESFSVAGGGFVNLDFFERMVSSPGVSLVTMLGEGSFHQVHGGTTTNLSEPDQLIRSYADQYEELRGRRFQVPPQRAHYIGSLTPAACRTKSRRMNSFQLFKDAHAAASDGRPVRPMPVPQELKAEFIDAFWRSGEWHRTSWLGRLIHRAPSDLLIYQELVFRLQPDWIVETRTGAGGLALFLASICDLIDHGQVLSIDGYPLGSPPDHPRIKFLRGDPAAERTADQARSLVGQQPRGLVILGGAGADQLISAFRNYESLVPVGSYVVVEDTILGGNPVWPAFGSRPALAVEEIVQEGDFVHDRSLERFALTFNVGGFLRRVR
jgi:cephalosporin hydroxylase